MKKTIALLLCLVMVLSFPASATAAGSISAQSDGSVKEKTEVVSKRDAYSKTYLLPDGTYSTWHMQNLSTIRIATVHTLKSTTK